MKSTHHSPSVAVARELTPGEVIRWQARPDEFALARRQWGQCAGGLYFVVFSIFWTIGILGGLSHGATSRKGAPWPVGLMGLVFFGAGVWMVLTPWREWRRAERTLYVVTTRQALIIELGDPTKVTRYDRASLGRTIRTERDDGRGDLVLERFTTQGHRGSTRSHDIGFFGIGDVAAVDRMVRELHEHAP
ncbi:MAG: hypothetical protein JWM57_1705 [Phycisphaerales bacterium]|nr:hypothetical protein [Phycisphaerales bacterium]